MSHMPWEYYWQLAHGTPGAPWLRLAQRGNVSHTVGILLAACPWRSRSAMAEDWHSVGMSHIPWEYYWQLAHGTPGAPWLRLAQRGNVSHTVGILLAACPWRSRSAMAEDWHSVGMSHIPWEYYWQLAHGAPGAPWLRLAQRGNVSHTVGILLAACPWRSGSAMAETGTAWEYYWQLAHGAPGAPWLRLAQRGNVSHTVGILLVACPWLRLAQRGNVSHTVGILLAACPWRSWSAMAETGTA